MALVKAKFGYSPEQVIEKGATEEEAPGEGFGVSVNMKQDDLAKILYDTRRVLPLFDTKESNANTEALGGRIDAESDDEYGFHDRYNLMVDRPIYGAAIFGHQERLHGARTVGLSYGDCAITIKSEVIESRTTFTYGDSMNNRFGRGGEAETLGEEVMVAEEAEQAKIIHERQPKSADPLRDQYLEAQILGGIDMDDIETISVPFQTAVKLKIAFIAKRYPGIKIYARVTPEEAEIYGGEEAIKKMGTKSGINVVIEKPSKEFKK